MKNLAADRDSSDRGQTPSGDRGTPSGDGGTPFGTGAGVAGGGHNGGKSGRGGKLLRLNGSAFRRGVASISSESR
jgi:hypothetical protein